MDIHITIAILLEFLRAFPLRVSVFGEFNILPQCFDLPTTTLYKKSTHPIQNSRFFFLLEVHEEGLILAPSNSNNVVPEVVRSSKHDLSNVQEFCRVILQWICRPHQPYCEFPDLTSLKFLQYLNMWQLRSSIACFPLLLGYTQRFLSAWCALC